MQRDMSLHLLHVGVNLHFKWIHKPSHLRVPTLAAMNFCHNRLNTHVKSIIAVIFSAVNNQQIESSVDPDSFSSVICV